MRLIFTIFFFTSFLLNAQVGSKSAEVFCTNGYNGTSTVKVKWLYKSVYEPGGFDVYRQEAGTSSWDKLNSVPVTVTTVLPANNKLDKEAKDLHNLLVKSDFKEFSIGISRAFVLIKAIYVDELADYIGITYDDKTAVSGKSYQYKVCLAGSSVAQGQSVSIRVADYVKPLPPEQLKLTRTKKRVDISWKPDVYRYYAIDVYKRTTEEQTFTKVSKVPRAIQKDQADKYSEKSIFFQDTSIVYKANYIYKFIAIDYFGQSSEFTVEYNVAAQDFIPPAAAADVVPTASSVNSSVRLDWKLIDESDLAGVNIYSSLFYDSAYVKVNAEVVPKTTLSYTDKNLQTGGHYYKLSTVDAAGNETFSPPVFSEIKDITPPAKPQGLVSESAEGAITLKWQANTEKDLRGYHVQRSLKVNGNINSSYVNVTKEPITQITYTEQLSKNIRNEFVYRIVAIDTCFNRSIPSENTLAQMPDVISPLQPVIKNITSDTLKANVSWLPNADIDIAGYNLYRALHGDTIVIAKVNFSLIPASLSSYNDREVKPGAEYDYYLEATDSTGNNSKRSPAFYSKIPELKIRGSIRIDEKKYNAKKGVLRIEWTAEASEEIKGYVVYRQLSKELPFKPVSGLLTDNQFDLTIGEKTNGLIQIKCYTQQGKIITSENFNIITE
ncbi:MAG TPA: hypothetical protein VGC65_09645 [Bacteroidia bacterium]|jgi:hypothetical protein